MAGVNGTGDNRTGSDGGVFGAQARAQYGALADLRWHMFINGLRSNQGVFELGARTFSYVIYACMGVGLGALMGVGAYLLVSHDRWKYLPGVFWVLFLIWQVVPIALASFQEQFDISTLLRFPVRFGSFFLLYVVFGLVDISTILGALCCVGIWIGITWVHPELFAWTAVSLGVFAVFNVLTVRAIFAWIDRWLAQRKTREIVGALFLIAVLSLQLLNPAFRQSRHSGPRGREDRAESYRKMGTEMQPWLARASAVERWLPPGLAARSLRRAAEGQAALGVGSFGVLGIYLLVSGGISRREPGAGTRAEIGCAGAN
jgi:ABC-2 type transport system permease protein